MPRTTVTLTDDLYAAVEAYQRRHSIKTFAGAVVALARIGLETETGEAPPEAAPWGGWRGSENSIEALLRHVDSITDKGRNDPGENISSE